MPRSHELLGRSGTSKTYLAIFQPVLLERMLLETTRDRVRQSPARRLQCASCTLGQDQEVLRVPWEYPRSADVINQVQRLYSPLALLTVQGEPRESGRQPQPGWETDLSSPGENLL